MNDKQKHIEEMAIVLSDGSCKKCDCDANGRFNCILLYNAELLYNANCRIIPEGSVVVSKEEREELNDTIRGALEREEKWRKLCDIKTKEIEAECKQAVKEYVKRFNKVLVQRKINLTNIDSEVLFDIEDISNTLDEVAKEFGVEL